MSFVSQSHLELVRSRKNMQKAFAEQNWQQLKEGDNRLGDALNNAFDDDQRNAVELVHEMEKILNLYADIVENLPQSAAESLKSFPRFQP